MHTVIGRNVLTGLKKVMNVLGVSALLFGNNLQFNTDEILDVLDPVLDIWFRFNEEFFFHELENFVLGVLWEVVSGCIDSMEIGHHIWWEVFG